MSSFRPRQRNRGRALVASTAVLLGVVAGIGTVGSVGAVVDDAGAEAQSTVFVAMTPRRVLDTRVGIGGHHGKLATDLDVTIRGVADVPDDAVGVVLNVTVTEPTAPSFLAVRPAGETPSTVSNLNYLPGETVANQVTVKLGTGGRIWLHNEVGEVHVVADVAGYYLPGTGVAGQDGRDGNSVRSGAGSPDVSLGVDGDFYIDTSGHQLHGPKTNGSWPPGTSIIGPQGTAGQNGADGRTIHHGTGMPGALTGANGDFYLDTVTLDFYGPKSGTGWGSPTNLRGQDGTDGKTVLNGAGNPTSDLGTTGDFYLDTATLTLYGPKTNGGWGTGTSLRGENGSNGSNGTNGRTILNGTGAPDPGLGTDGDFYLDTTATVLYGPRTAGGWGAGTSLRGQNGENGTAGTNGTAILNGNGAPDAGLGADGDFYLDTGTHDLYGPRTPSGWGAPTPLGGGGAAMQPAYGFFYSPSTTVLAQGDLIPLEDVTSDLMTLSPDGKTITVEEEGVYQISFEVALSTSDDVAIALFVDGTPDTSTRSYAVPGVNTIALRSDAIFFLEMPADTTLSLGSMGPAHNAQLTGAQPGARLVIQRVAP